MSYLKLHDANIYYERNGCGKTLVLLNGIMMSTTSWTYHVEKLAKIFDVITLDFRDQGNSSKMKDGYDLSVHSNDLSNLLEHLKIRKASILGVSYGAHVAEIFALEHPDKIEKLILSNAVDKTDNYLRELGRAWEIAAQTYDATLFFKVSLPTIYSRTFYNSHLDWVESRIKTFSKVMTREWFDAFIRLSKSEAYFDVSKDISKIVAPTLLIAAEEDMITPKSIMERMHKKIKDSLIVSIPQAGHAAFLEKADLFCDIIKGFLN